MTAALLFAAAVLAEPTAPAAATAAEPAAAGVSLLRVDDSGEGFANWTGVNFGGEGLVEVVAAGEDEDADEPPRGPILRIGAGDPLTGVKYTGPVDGDDGDDGDDNGGDSTNDDSAADSLPRINYRLTWQARRTLGGDFFSSVLFPVGDDLCSVVVGGWGGGVIGLSSLDGMDASENITTNFQLFDDDTWYDFALTVTPGTIELTIDGEAMFEVNPADYAVTTRIEMEPLKPLGLATYQSTGEIRDLRVERLE